MKAIFRLIMDSEGKVVGDVYGALFGHGVKLPLGIYDIPYHETPDVVLSNSYPCDLDFWQSHKARYPAQRMVKEGGVIITCTPALEGIGPPHTNLLDFVDWPSTAIEEACKCGELKKGFSTSLAAVWAMVREKTSVSTDSCSIGSGHKTKLGHTHSP